MKVLFVGDINVDIVMGNMDSFIQRDKEILCKDFSITMGSSSGITACSYSLLGGDASFCGLAGDDEYGRFMLSGFKERNVNTNLIDISTNDKTGVTVNLIYGLTRSQVTYPGTIKKFNGTDIINDNLLSYDHIHFAGIYQQDAFRDSFYTLLLDIKKAGITTSLDPQWDSSEKWIGMETWLPLLTYLFVNDDEALSITGMSNTKEAWKCLSRMNNCPIVKLGKNGAIANGHTISGYNIDVVDTTGAGDAFSAGFLYMVLENNSSVNEAVQFANAVGARNCLFSGGVSSNSTYEDILFFIKDN